MQNTFYQDVVVGFHNILYSDPFRLQILYRTKRYIDVNFDRKIDLKDLALLQGFSRYHLLRLFKFYYGITPKQYQIHQRIKEAKNKLTNGCTVSESCYDVGFQSVTTFSTLFKRKTGMTPREFKNSNF